MPGSQLPRVSHFAMSSDRCWGSQAKDKNGAKVSVSVLSGHPPSLEQGGCLLQGSPGGASWGREGSHRWQQELGWGPPAAAQPPGRAAVLPFRELCEARPVWLITASRRVTGCQNARSDLSVLLSNCFVWWRSGVGVRKHQISYIQWVLSLGMNWPKCLSRDGLTAACRPNPAHRLLCAGSKRWFLQMDICNWLDLMESHESKMLTLPKWISFSSL